MPARPLVSFARLRDSCNWKELRSMFFINVLIAGLLSFVYFDFKTAGWLDNIIQVFIFSQAIGFSIYFFVYFSDILSVQNLWKRSAGLTLVFGLGGCIGTIVALGINY